MCTTLECQYNKETEDTAFRQLKGKKAVVDNKRMKAG